MTRTKLIDRVRKLQALATSDNQHEAEAAAKMASDLMEKHQLSMSEVDIKELKNSGITEENYTVDGQKMKLNWITNLAHGCAKLFDGTILVNGKLHGTSFVFVGFEEDIPMMKAMFENLYATWHMTVAVDLGVAKSEHNKQHEINGWNPPRWAPKDTMGFKAGHGAAYSNAIYWRCVELARDRKNNVGKTATGTALVIMKDQQMDEYGTKKGWATRKQTQSTGTASGRRFGREAGNSARLSTELN